VNGQHQYERTKKKKHNEHNIEQNQF